MSRADDSIWSAVVLATNEDHPKQAPAELEKYATQLKNIFGYNQYELMGQHVELMNNSAEHWLVPSQHFWMSVQEKHAYEDGYLVNLTLYHDQRQLVETEGKVSPSSPLIMRGPMHARGQIVFVIQIVR